MTSKKSNVKKMKIQKNTKRKLRDEMAEEIKYDRELDEISKIMKSKTFQEIEVFKSELKEQLKTTHSNLLDKYFESWGWNEDVKDSNIGLRVGEKEKQYLEKFKLAFGFQDSGKTIRFMMTQILEQNIFIIDQCEEQNIVQRLEYIQKELVSYFETYFDPNNYNEYQIDNYCRENTFKEFDILVPTGIESKHISISVADIEAGEDDFTTSGPAGDSTVYKFYHENIIKQINNMNFSALFSLLDVMIAKSSLLQKELKNVIYKYDLGTLNILPSIYTYDQDQFEFCFPYNIYVKSQQMAIENELNLFQIEQYQPKRTEFLFKWAFQAKSNPLLLDGVDIGLISGKLNKPKKEEKEWLEKAGLISSVRDNLKGSLDNESNIVRLFKPNLLVNPLQMKLNLMLYTVAKVIKEESLEKIFDGIFKRMDSDFENICSQWKNMENIPDEMSVYNEDHSEDLKIFHTKIFLNLRNEFNDLQFNDTQNKIRRGRQVSSQNPKYKGSPFRWLFDTYEQMMPCELLPHTKSRIIETETKSQLELPNENFYETRNTRIKKIIQQTHRNFL